MEMQTFSSACDRPANRILVTWQGRGAGSPHRGDPSYQGCPRELWAFTLGLCGAITGPVNKTDGGVIRARHAFRYGLSRVRKV